MRLNHHRPSVVTTQRGRRGRGYILVQFALLLVPLLLMAGFSVDVGYWYNRASDIQKAADAAALAGVVWLPDVPEAKARALEAAERNGFKNGTNGITVTVEKVAGTTRQLRVTINDPTVHSFFYENLGGSSIDLSRDATAEYVLPVPLGSPENIFGNDPALPVASQAGLWGNIHGPKTDNYKGDLFAPECRGGDNCGTSSNQNPDHRSSGYLYAIDVPAGVSNMDVQIYDAGMFPRTAETIETGDTNYNGRTDSRKTTTRWTFYNRDATDLDVSDNPVATNGLCSSQSPSWNGPTSNQAVWVIPEALTNTSYMNKWASICKKSGTVTQGRYLLRVQSEGVGSSANRYSVRVLASTATKPRISAYGDFSMYNNINAGNANFYLAEVGPEHRGKTLELEMYDPGEVSGTGTMKILNPTGSVAGSCIGTSDSPSSTFTSGSTLSPCQFTTSVNGSAKYNGYRVKVAIKVPNNYTCTPGLTTAAGCWWKVRYEISGQANDTTTWSAQIIGDPVHLVEEG